MGGEGEDLEPLFDYHRVQPSNFVCIDDDDDSDVSEVPVKKREKASHTVAKKDEDVKVVKVIEVAGDDDWLPPPPKVVFDKSKEAGEDSTIKALRTKKMELMSFTKTAVDVMQEAKDSAKKEAQVSLKPSSEAPAQAPPGPINDRAKIVITIQDKAGQKQFRVYAVSASAAASAAAAASMRTVVVRFADADAAADAAAYHIATAGFIGVSRRTQRSDAAAAAGSCVNETNKS